MKILAYKRELLCACSILCAWSPLNAQTETSTNLNDTVEATPARTDDIVVTAEKRQTKLRDVPTTVNVLDGDAIERAQITDLEGVTRLTPGFEFSDVNGGQLAYPSIRGVSPQVYGDPTVVVFEDGVSLGTTNRASAVEIFDVERVEVLKGPQSTLYGANSLAGVVNLISRRPTRDPEMRGQLSYGSYGTLIARTSVSGPVISDRLFARLSGSVNRRDGYYDNIFSGEEGSDSSRQYGVRLGLDFQPGPAFDSLLNISYQETNNDTGDSMNPIVGYDPSQPKQIGSGVVSPSRLHPYINQNVDGFYDRRLVRGSWENSLEAGSVRVTSLTGYGELSADTLFDLNRLPTDFSIFRGIITNVDFDIWSEELRVASTGATRLKWLLGAFYSNQNTRSGGTFETTFGTSLPTGRLDEDLINYAFFTSNSIDLGDTLTIGVGLRYDHVKRSDSVSGLSIEGSEWLPKLSVLYKVDSLNNIYASAAKGYKSGGINANASVAQVPVGYGAERLWNYEVGFKGSNTRRSLSYEVAAYYIDWTNQQVQQASGIFTFLSNAGKTEAYGLEAVTHWQPTEALSLDFAASYNHSRYKKYVDITGVPVFFGLSANRAGARTFLAPDWVFSSAAEYTYPLSGGADIRLRGDVRYTSKRALDTASVLIDEAYVLSNASISYGTGQLRLTAFANNMFNVQYATAAALFNGLDPITHRGEPRVMGVRLDFEF